jgi:hypothetical protein
LLLLYELGIWMSGFITAHSKAPEEAASTASTEGADPR